MLSAAGQRATGAMHRALTAYDLQSAAVESGSTALVRSMSLVSLSGDSSGRNLAPGSALSSRVARLLDGTLVRRAALRPCRAPHNAGRNAVNNQRARAQKGDHAKRPGLPPRRIVC